MSIYVKRGNGADKLCIDLLDVYPVGSIYISVSDTDPGDLFGGTWERFGNGHTLMGVDEDTMYFYKAGVTGGEAEHTLTADELPSHRHNVWSYISSGSQTFHTGSSPAINSTVVWSSQDKNNYQLYTQKQGSGQAHNNLPPYITVYMWKRTA